MRPVSVYVHVPFCRRRCPYCTFYHVPAGERRLETDYVRGLTAEFRTWTADFGEPFTVPTVYLGGGTPSVLGYRGIETIVGALTPHLTEGGAEVTIELNPEDVTTGWTDRLRRLGVTRISLGVQSMSGDAQRVLGRCSPETNERAISEVRSAFANFSFDLLVGVPRITRDALEVTLDRVARARPPHLSVYCLEPGGDLDADRTAFFADVDPDRAAEEYLIVCDRLRALGYHHYEISNFAIPGFECRHNQVYWLGGDYLGLGPGAHSYLGGERFHNIPSVASYLGGGEAVRQHDHRDASERRLEALMLALRTSAGLALDRVPRGSPVVAELVGGGLAGIDSGRLVLSDRGFLVLNEIVHRLSPAG